MKTVFIFLFFIYIGFAEGVNKAELDGNEVCLDKAELESILSQVHKAHSQSIYLGNFLHNNFKQEVDKLYNINQETESTTIDAYTRLRDILNK